MSKMLKVYEILYLSFITRRGHCKVSLYNAKRFSVVWKVTRITKLHCNISSVASHCRVSTLIRHGDDIINVTITNP